MAYNKFDPNYYYDELNKFPGSFNLQYTALYFSALAQKAGAMAQCPPPT